MSSTNRGYERHRTDYYITPQYCIKDFLNHWLKDEGIDRPDRLFWLDPCSGGDDKNEMSYPNVLKKEFGVDMMTIDIREDSKAERKENYLTAEIKEPKPDIIITNPPFFLAVEIIEKALNDVVNGGYVVMLLRLNFFGSKGRKKLFEKHMPKYTYVNSKRISFTENGGTDSIEYAHFVWEKGYKPQFTKLKVI